jgi:hypothetical protein
MPDRDAGSGAGRDGKSLRHVRAAQLRARAIRGAISQSVLGMVFLLGALAHALSPWPGSPSSRFWIPALIVLSTVYVGLGLRTFSRVRRKAQRIWLPATLLWGLLSAALLKILVAR